MSQPERAGAPSPGGANDAVEQARRALKCLRLEVDPTIAADVSAHVEAAFAALSGGAPAGEALREAVDAVLAHWHAGNIGSTNTPGSLAMARLAELRAGAAPPEGPTPFCADCGGYHHGVEPCTGGQGETLQ